MSEMTDKKAAEKEAKIKEYLAKTNNDASLDILAKTAEDYGKGLRKEVWPTGFPMLDCMLDGGLHGSQLACIGAISSLGKTSFVLQIATQIAEQGKDVLIFSLEMSKEELNARTISRYSFIRRMELGMDTPYGHEDDIVFTTNDILKGDVASGVVHGRDAFAESLEKARKVAPHTFIYVGNNNISVDDIKQKTELHIAATGRKPVVILDYLQILSASKNAIEKHYDIRRSTNDDITSLKVLAREHDICVLVISALNRASYADSISMSSFRESSGIEYSVDTLFGLQYEGMDLQEGNYSENGVFSSQGRESSNTHYTRVLKLFEDMQKLAAAGQKQPIELKILKNRNGARGTVPFYFTPKYNYFAEQETPHEESSISASTKSAAQKSAEKPVRKL